MTSVYDTPLPLAARATDPHTSQSAALDDTGRDVLLRRLRGAFVSERRWSEDNGFKSRGLTRDEAADRARMPATSNTSRRLSDLRDLGVIEDSGFTRRGDAGRFQTVWRLTDTGWTEAQR